MKVPDTHAGKKVKCPKCAAVISVPAVADEPAEVVADAPAPAATDRPRPAVPPPEAGEEQGGEEVPAAPKKKSKKGLYIGLGIGCGALLGFCCCGGGIATFLLLPETNDKVTHANFKRLKEGMTRAQVEEVLGPGKEATRGDVEKIYKEYPPQDFKYEMDNWGPRIDQKYVYRWQNGSDMIFVAYDKPPSQNGKTQKIVWVTSSKAGGYYRENEGFFPQKK
jgi:hypothetical protein